MAHKSEMMDAIEALAKAKDISVDQIVEAVEACGFFESIPLWAVTLIGGLFIWVLAFVMILT